MKELLKISLSANEVIAACGEYARQRTIFVNDDTVETRATVGADGTATIVFIRKRVRKARAPA